MNGIGFSDALARHGHNAAIVKNAPTIEGGYQAAKWLIGRNPQVTAIFAYNDLMALGALRACRDIGKTVPNDIALVGFDDIHLTSISTPSLTSIRVDKYTLGSKAMTRLLEMLAEPDKQFLDLEMPMELIRREST